MQQGFENFDEEVERGLNADAEQKTDIFKEFGFYTVNSLTEEERRPPEFLVEGMLPVGLTFLSGAPKTRKSFLALQLAIAVASGQPFWGHSTVQCDVVYCDLEGSKSRISSRTQAMGIRTPDNLFITNTLTEKLADGLTEKLRLLHRQRPSIRLIILDTFSHARGVVKTGGQNAYDADVMLLEPLQQMALSENIAVLFVHHLKKGASLATDSFEQMSGTMGISGSCDAVWILTSEGGRSDGRAKLEITPRDAPGCELSLVFDQRFMAWFADERKADLRGNPGCAWLLDHVPERGTTGTFIPYEEAAQQIFRCYTDHPGDRVLELLKPYKQELYDQHGIGLQLSVKSNGKRGLRVINMS